MTTDPSSAVPGASPSAEPELPPPAPAQESIIKNDDSVVPAVETALGPEVGDHRKPGVVVRRTHTQRPLETRPKAPATKTKGMSPALIVVIVLAGLAINGFLLNLLFNSPAGRNSTSGGERVDPVKLAEMNEAAKRDEAARLQEQIISDYKYAQERLDRLVVDLKMGKITLQYLRRFDEDGSYAIYEGYNLGRGTKCVLRARPKEIDDQGYDGKRFSGFVEDLGEKPFFVNVTYNTGAQTSKKEYVQTYQSRGDLRAECDQLKKRLIDLEEQIIDKCATSEVGQRLIARRNQEAEAVIREKKRIEEVAADKMRQEEARRQLLQRQAEEARSAKEEAERAASITRKERVARAESELVVAQSALTSAIQQLNELQLEQKGIMEEMSRIEAASGIVKVDIVGHRWQFLQSGALEPEDGFKIPGKATTIGAGLVNPTDGSITPCVVVIPSGDRSFKVGSVLPGDGKWSRSGTARPFIIKSKNIPREMREHPTVKSLGTVRAFLMLNPDEEGNDPHPKLSDRNKELLTLIDGVAKRIETLNGDIVDIKIIINGQ